MTNDENILRRSPANLVLVYFQKLCSLLCSWKLCSIHAFSLTPSSSPMPVEPPGASRFNGFSSRGKPLKRLIADGFAHTGLKSGVNERGDNIFGDALVLGHSFVIRIVSFVIC